MYARSTTVLAHPESIDAGIAHIRDEVMPTLLGIDGCIGLSMLVDEWEIAVLHRDHASGPAACVRATWVRMDPAQADRAVDVYRMGLLPVMQGYAGFCSASLLIDRESGLGVSSVTYDGVEAMQRSRDRADALRESGAREAGVEIVEVCEFDLALAHLRVPEMA